MRVATDDIRVSLGRDGYAVTRVSVSSAESVRFVVDLGHSLGELYALYVNLLIVEFAKLQHTGNLDVLNLTIEECAEFVGF